MRNVNSRSWRCPTTGSAPAASLANRLSTSSTRALHAAARGLTPCRKVQLPRCVRGATRRCRPRPVVRLESGAAERPRSLQRRMCHRPGRFCPCSPSPSLSSRGRRRPAQRPSAPRPMPRQASGHANLERRIRQQEPPRRWRRSSPVRWRHSPLQWPPRLAARPRHPQPRDLLRQRRLPPWRRQ
jgi:hypothetical protein